MSDTVENKPAPESKDSVGPATSASTLPSKSGAAGAKESQRILLVGYPKIVFLYPTYIAAFLAALILSAMRKWTADSNDMTAVVLTWLFLGVAGVNMMILAFDFPRTTSLTIFFFIVAVVMGLILLFTFQPQLLPAIGKLLENIRPVANAMFFIVFLFVLTLIYIGVFVSLRFDYWEIRPNELLHHYGFLSDLKRFSAPNLRIDKEINDVFEFFLLGSGRLILQPSGERRAIIVDNVLFINKKETAIIKMLSSLQVEVRTEETKS